MDVVGVVGQRERRSAQADQGDDLPWHDFGREEQDRTNGALGDPAGLLMAQDRGVAERRDVHSVAGGVR